MLLALWPLFISTTPLPPQQDISGLVAQYNEQRYEKAIAKHVNLHISTSQKQEIKGFISAKHDPQSAQQKAFAFANTWQHQEVTGSISVSSLGSLGSLSEFAKPAKLDISKTLASTHFSVNVATAQSQSVSGIITGHEPDISVVRDCLATSAIGNVSTAQSQYIVCRIISKQPVAEVGSVSAHYQLNASTAQTQEISGNISTHHFVDANNMVSVKAATYQHQAISGRITTNGDDEMMMVLLALLAMDDDVV